MMKTAFAGALCALLLLSGCASFKSQPFNAANNQSINTIGLLPFGQPEKPDIVLENLTGDSRGLIGAVIAEGQRKIATVKFQRMTDAQNFHPAADTRQAVRSALEADGYQVIDVPMARAASPKFLETYPSGRNDVDAYLDIYTETVGYLSASSRDLRPTVYLGAKMIRANSGEILFADRILVNAYGNNPNGVTIEPPADYEYQSQAALMVDGAAAVEGIREAIKLAADGLAQRLKK